MAVLESSAPGVDPTSSTLDALRADIGYITAPVEPEAGIDVVAGPQGPQAASQVGYDPQAALALQPNPDDLLHLQNSAGAVGMNLTTYAPEGFQVPPVQMGGGSILSDALSIGQSVAAEFQQPAPHIQPPAGMMA